MELDTGIPRRDSHHSHIVCDLSSHSTFTIQEQAIIYMRRKLHYLLPLELKMLSEKDLKPTVHRWLIHPLQWQI